MIYSSLLLAVALSLDALGVGMVYGLRKIVIPPFSRLVICFFSIFYTLIALYAGRALSAFIPPHTGKWAGVTILLLMGLWILWQAFRHRSEWTDPVEKYEKSVPSEANINTPVSVEATTIIRIAIRSLGLTIHVVKNPTEIDQDHSGVIDFRESLLLGLGLSLDALGVGFGSGLLGLSSPLIPFAAGIFQLVFLHTGITLGRRCAEKLKFNRKVLAFLPGVLLILLAVIRMR